MGIEVIYIYKIQGWEVLAILTAVRMVVTNM